MRDPIILMIPFQGLAEEKVHLARFIEEKLAKQNEECLKSSKEQMGRLAGYQV